MTPLPPSLAPYAYAWPRPDSLPSTQWRRLPGGTGAPGWLERRLPESREELAADSRWPGFFPSPIALVTAGEPGDAVLEKVVGASIVNRFPYTLALSFCVESLSERHHPRGTFLDRLLAGGWAAVQFLAPGDALDRALRAIAEVPEADSRQRLAAAGLATRPALGSPVPVLEDAFLVYEARLARPSRDAFGEPVLERPVLDVGSHRIVFLEITAIQLDREIAAGRRRIRWRSLPAWQPRHGGCGAGDPAARAAVLGGVGYRKGYTADYAFPSAGTVAFEADAVVGGMAVRTLPPSPEGQVEVDNDRARWPCFFPSSVGMITSRAADGRVNVMPCGSTTVVSRHPLTIAACLSYSPINERYAPRASLDTILATGRFGCGVPYGDPALQEAIGYLGNVSIRRDPDKVANAGLTLAPVGASPVLEALPVHFDCRVVGRHKLGTHVMLLGEVERVLVREDVTADTPLLWCPWADVGSSD